MLTALLLLQAEGAPQGATDAGQSSGGGSMFIPLLLILAIFWLIVIGPERKNRKKREAMLGAIQKGDKVMTSSGMYGSIVQVQEDILTVQVADGVRIRFARQAIQQVIEGDEQPEPAK